MNRAELEARLRRLCVHPDAYSLDGSYKNEATILDQEGSGWVVYYSERGERTNPRRFQVLDEACDYVLDQLATDPLTRARPGPGTVEVVAEWKRWWKFW